MTIQAAMRVFFLLILILGSPFLRAIDLRMADEFEIDPTVLAEHALSLNGHWQFHWGRLVNPTQVTDPDIQWQMVNVPGVWNDLVDEGSPMNHGVATFAVRLNFHSDLQQDLTINFVRVSEAFKGYLVRADGTEVISMFEGGRLSGQPEGHVVAPDYLSFALPQAEGHYWLVLQVSKFIYYKGGIRSPVTIDINQRRERLGVYRPLTHGIVIGALIYMALNHLQIFINRRQSTSSLLLSLACLFVALRSLVGYGYFEGFFSQPSNIVAIWRFRLELLTVVLPATIWLHFYHVLFSGVLPRWVVQLSWTGSILLTLAVLVITPDWLAYVILPAEQMWLLINMVGISYSVLRAIKLRRPDAVVALVSFGIVSIGVINDLISTRTAHYDLYITEYAMLLFLLLHAQLLARRYAIAIQNEIRLIHDNRKLTREREAAEREATIDHLTGVLNRKGLEVRLDQAWNTCIREQTCLSLLIIDADYFKQLNDRYGHLKGDYALVFLASVMRGLMLRSNDFHGRWGGEEFMVVMPGAVVQAAAEVAEIIRDSVEKAVLNFENEHIRFTVSIGVSNLTPQPGDGSWKAIIQQADEALYEAKARGRNQICVYSDLLHTH
ncbi:diguanylate cyclase [Gynuella sp.]|uniref:GGDEF domain-containing protein n=1 Tax=Gynuella sp. TaxID=2969146 RepID=UPI003D11BBA0